jgi:hypothetical protein
VNHASTLACGNFSALEPSPGTFFCVLRWFLEVEGDSVSTLTTPLLVKHIKPEAPEQLAGDLIPRSHPLFGILWINRGRLAVPRCFGAREFWYYVKFAIVTGGVQTDALRDPHKPLRSTAYAHSSN